MADRFKIALGKTSPIIPVTDVKTTKITIGDRLGRAWRVELISVDMYAAAISGGTLTSIEIKIFWAGPAMPETLSECVREVLRVTMPNNTVYDVRIQNINTELCHLQAGVYITYTGQVENIGRRGST
jgi:hypothetical protein